MLQLEAIRPIVHDLDPVHRRLVDRKHERRLVRIPVAESREAVRVFDVGERAAGVRVQVRHESESVVVDYPLCIRYGFQGSFESGVRGVDDIAHGVPFGGGVDAEVAGPERREVLWVEVGHEHIGCSGVEECGY